MRKRIGEFLVEKGVLEESQIQQLLEHSQRTGQRLGDAALELKLVSRDKMIEIFGPNFRIDYFHLDPSYFPAPTKDLLTSAEIVRLGALPLGFKESSGLFKKRRVLNVGMLDPGDPGKVAEVESLIKSKAPADEQVVVKFYLVLVDQFLNLVQSIYGVTESEIQSRGAGGVDRVLAMFLEIDQEETQAGPSPSY